MAVRISGAMVLPRGVNQGKDTAKNVLTIMLAGRELGIGPMQALRQLDIINGQISLRARLKLALAKRAGLVIDSIEESERGCKITAHRTDTGEVGVGEFTEEERVKAKLGNEPDSAWKKYPKSMFWARASSQLVDRLCPDSPGASMHSTEELTEIVSDD
jgi:hypothetical protein